MQAIAFESEVHDGVIKLPRNLPQWEDKPVRVILLDKEDSPPASPPHRSPHPAIAGKGKTQGDLLAPLVAESDWECLK